MRLLHFVRLLVVLAPLVMAGAWAAAATACPVEAVVPAKAEDDCCPKGARADLRQCVAICHASVLPGGPQIVRTVAFDAVSYDLDQDDADGASLGPDVPPPRRSPAA